MYLRYVDNDGPPLVEYYGKGAGYYRLTDVLFDRDGDWLDDTLIKFDRNGNAGDLVPLATGPAVKMYPLDRLPNEMRQYLAEPPGSTNINATAMATEEYREAVSAIRAIGARVRASTASNGVAGAR